MLRRIAVFALISVAMSGFAQAANPEPGPSLIDTVQRICGKHRAPVVVVAPESLSLSRQRITNTPGVNLQSAMETIASGLQRPAIPSRRIAAEPFAATRIGAVWTISESIVPQPLIPPARPTTAGAYTSVPPAQGCDWTVRSLSARQLSQATGTGIPYSDLTFEQRDLLKAAFRLPVTLTNETAGSDRHLVFDNPAKPSRAVNIDASVLHVYTVFGDWHLVHNGRSVGRAYFRRLGHMALFDNRGNMPFGTSTARVRHVEKASALDFGASALKRPIAKSGVLSIGAAVSATAKASRLDLTVDLRLKDRQVFVGDGALSAGSVLRAITFDVNGTWRRIGQMYFLTPERYGLQQRRILVNQADAPNRMVRVSLENRFVRPEWSANALENLRPEPGGNPGPTPEQIAVLRERWRKASRNTPRTLAFAELNSDQQAGVLAATSGGEYYDFNPVPGESAWKPTTEGPVKDGDVESIDYVAYLEVPGVGRLRFEHPMPVIARISNGAPGFVDPKPALPVPSPHSITLQPAVRALAIAPVPKNQWGEIFRTMKAKGIAVLYFPVLWDGQTLHRSRYFPQLPMARGGDTLADFLRRAKANHIQVIGVVNALTWRLPGGPDDHWLAKRRDLLDVDVLGRSRRDWLLGPAGADPPDTMSAPHLDSIMRDTSLVADFVSSRSAEVRSRLLGLLGELRKYHGLSGIALRHWTSITGWTFGDAWAPDLGYTDGARSAFITRFSVDPVDLGAGPTFDTQTLDFETAHNLTNLWETARLSADADLANLLLSDMRNGWPGRVHYFVKRDEYTKRDYPPTKVTLPSGNIEIPGLDPQYGGDPAHTFAWATAPGQLTIRGRSPLSRGDRLAVFADSANHTVTSDPWSREQTPAGVVLDFTAAPDLLYDGLSLLKDAN